MYIRLQILHQILYSYLMGVDAIDQTIPSTSGQIVWSIASTPIK